MLDDLDEGYYFFFDLFSSVLWNKSFAGKSSQEVISILYQIDVMLMWYVIKQNSFVKRNNLLILKLHI